MAQLRYDYQKFVELDSEIVVVGPEDSSAFKKYWQKEDLPFIGLPDKTHTVLKLYAQQVSIFKLGRMPAQMIVDKSGILRYVHYGHSMMDIPANSELFELLNNLTLKI